MTARIRPPLLAAAVLLLGSAPVAFAQSSLPDPIAPAVIGRPLDQIGPVRPKAPPKPAATRPVAAKPAPAPRVAAKPAAPAATVAVAAPAAAPVQQKVAKQAVDDRAEAANTDGGEVGQGSRLARKPLGEGAYIGPRHRAAVHRYYEAHPVMRPAVRWKIGQPVPPDAVAALPPRGLLAVLPRLPPGHFYAELGGEVVLVASGSKMVVDGISRPRAETAQLAR